MKVIIEINCDNAAFEDNPLCEVERILSSIDIQHQEFCPQILKLYDSNGNSVGRLIIE